MVVNMENQSAKVETVLWVLAAALLASGVIGQYYFSAYGIMWRVLGMLFVVAASIALVSRTLLARRLWAFWQDSIIELRKVIWPTRQETIHSTMAVLAMVFVMGIVLWSIDAVLVRAVAWIIRQGAA